MHLLEYGDCPPNALDERIARSWRRSLQAGLQPTGRLGDTCCSNRLRQALACNQELLAHSRPVMDHLYEQVRHSHNMVILSDRCATLLHTLGDADFLNKAERVALASGASWQEQYRGTNAIGTALAEASNIEVHGAEHFLERNGFLTCAAAPIMAADGTLLGVIDISGDQRSRHPHTLGLVGMAARMIENRLIISGSRHIRLHLHHEPEGIGSVAEGILVLSEDGWIVGANRSALSLLHLTSNDLGATPLTHIFDIRMDDLLAFRQRATAQPRPVHLHDGTTLFVQLHAEARARTVDVSAPPPTHDDALARLDLGDAQWHSATSKARRVLDKAIPLLIQGESGVGKELFARAVHDSGPRQHAAFVAINCAALPEHLIEAELFGYAPGAFTGARREGYAGRLREAHCGTLFLDEIGDMPLALQTRLLRVLQERQVTPLGGGKPVAIDCALICATHHNLREAVEQGRFRSDLYYRLNGLTLHLPALRERSDFPALTERLLAEHNPERDIRLSPTLLACLGRHAWPGNLRQYSSVLRTASAMLENDETEIAWSHLPDDLHDALTASMTATVSEIGTLPQNLAELSRTAIQQTLEDCRGNISAAARRLGISRQTLYRKLNS
jgi:transcriptional regulator of acetoin/glycerol metabolism